jgi:hypothetical protein
VKLDHFGLIIKREKRENRCDPDNVFRIHSFGFTPSVQKQDLSGGKVTAWFNG